jgi:predicted small lipoprotein YifL
VRGRFAWCVAVLAGLVGGASGCGLKGSLELPARSSNVVIRGPGSPATDPGTAAPTEPPSTTGTPEAPAGAPATGAPKDDERLPPPPLPGGNSGSARGG